MTEQPVSPDGGIDVEAGPEKVRRGVLIALGSPRDGSPIISAATGGCALGMMVGPAAVQVQLHIVTYSRYHVPPILGPAMLWGGLAGAFAGAIATQALPWIDDTRVALATGMFAVAVPMTAAVVKTPGIASITFAGSMMIALASALLGTPIGLFIRSVVAPETEGAPPDAESTSGTFVSRAAHVPHVSAHRRAVRERPFPPEWESILHNNLHGFTRLTEADRAELRSQVQVFLDEKHFEGCDGLVLTDEIRVTIAGYACRLTLRVDADYYPKLRSILVYPDTFVSARPTIGVVREEPEDRAAPDPLLGESWHLGAVVMSWKGIQHCIENPQEGKQLVMHEFAHQLDVDDGTSDGTPRLQTVDQYKEWRRVLETEYGKFHDAVKHEQSVVMDAYGATNESEFFAVATEFFFQSPTQMRQYYPEVFAILKQYYGQDPKMTP